MIILARGARTLGPFFPPVNVFTNIHSLPGGKAIGAFTDFLMKKR
ncbi:hypothetical protein EC100869_1533 [Escherichia coli 10.0869]|nr:hypothetical protein EC100869_1533 [Escherichia coli 10.0869]